MDQHALIRVLADPSRHAVYEDLVNGSGPATIGDIADRLDLHPNTVRLHLEKLRDAGLVESHPDRHGSVGRPHLRWAARWSAPVLGVEPGGMRMLAHLLADLAALDSGASDRARAVGRRRGGELVPEGGCPADRVGAAVDRLAQMGFDPTLESNSGRDVISFASCPFREVAVLYPELVCQLHRGITAAVVEQAGASLDGFSTLVDPDPCRAEVTLDV